MPLPTGSNGNAASNGTASSLQALMSRLAGLDDRMAASAEPQVSQPPEVSQTTQSRVAPRGANLSSSP